MDVETHEDVGFARLEEIDACRLSVQFKRAVYELVNTHPGAARDIQFRTQLFSAASGAPANIAEGFARNSTRVFLQFLGYARSSIVEALTWLDDGVDRRHFTVETIQDARALGQRAAGAIAALQRSLKPFLKR